MDISIVIPTLNGYALLEKTLKVLFRTQPGFIFEVIVVDNDSRDDTVRKLKRNFPEVKCISLFSNKGFTGAVNAGVREATGKYILILNNDCVIQTADIKKMFLFLTKNPKYIATQPVIYTTHRTIEQIGYVVDLVKAKAHVIKDLSYDFSKWDDQKEPFARRKVFGLSATCLLIERSVFLKLGMFDESFHSYLEDVDVCIRLVKNNYRFMPHIDASASHEHMATSKKMGSYKESHDLANWIRLIIKNYPVLFIIKYSPFLLIERLRNLSGLIKRKI
jgi:GT2 family glycosyltransferase